LQAFEAQQLAKSPRYSDLLPLLGARSMVLTEGAEWRAQRDAFNPGFASAFLRDAVPQFVGCTQHLVEALEAAADEGEAAAAAAAGGSAAGGGGGGARAGVVAVHHLVILLVG
jgi:cytochrome P450